jgi:hypothetical protein
MGYYGMNGLRAGGDVAGAPYYVGTHIVYLVGALWRLMIVWLPVTLLIDLTGIALQTVGMLGSPLAQTLTTVEGVTLLAHSLIPAFRMALAKKYRGFRIVLVAPNSN